MQSQYDLVVVGGGIAGASLAKTISENGYRVLVLERETKFKDRIRGEALVPWGVTEARALRIWDLLKQSCAHELRWFDQYAAGQQFEHRLLPETTPQGEPVVTVYHPAMQETLLAAAQQAGAEVIRGVTVTAVRAGTPAAVSIAGTDQELTARLVVGADGRNSIVRACGEFHVARDPERILMAGLLFDQMAAPEDTAHLFFHYDQGSNAVFFPQGGGRVRSYYVYQADAMPRLQGEHDTSRFQRAVLETGAADFFPSARPAGPLASFDCADTWVESPARDGLALIGDAAYSSNPAWGQGMALSLRDARVLKDYLLATPDWHSAASAYSAEHDRYTSVVRKVTGWFSALFLDPSPAGHSLRAAALPAIAQDPTRVPDHILSGPELPADDSVRLRFLGGRAAAPGTAATTA
jgi:2-polyprenyl-6-methoxyphenol hydroxylase-like FAD-dependent oxidoreductase